MIDENKKNEKVLQEEKELNAKVEEPKIYNTDKSVFNYFGEGFLKHTIKDASENMRYYHEKADKHFGKMMFFTGLIGLSAVSAFLGTSFTEGILKTTIKALSLSVCGGSLMHFFFHFSDYSGAKMHYKQEKMKFEKEMDAWVKSSQQKANEEKDIEENENKI